MDGSIWKKHRRELIRIGNSVGIILHKDELEKLGGLDAGDTVELTLTEDARLILTPLDG